MISKERLEQLIKEGATIWSSCGYSIDLSKTDSFIENIFEFYYTIEDNRLLKMQKQPHIALNQWWIKDLFETHKQAEWHLKYYKTRIEELDLPMWDEIKSHKDDFCYLITSFLCKNSISYGIMFNRGDLVIWNYSSLSSDWIDIPTEENYEKACDLCLKLFEGEEK